ncbi:Proton-coupled amino acid transporter 4 [Lucilia cuprina]|nr:Proton-coupled amino acid transporter 4 [Lucilia cuprina]
MGLPQDIQSAKTESPLELQTPKAREAAANVSEDVEATTKKSHRTSQMETAIHLFKGSVGAGLFAMGDCFKNGGLAGATIFLPIIALICVHCEQMLIAGSILAVERTKGATFYDYPDTVEKCFEYGPKPFRRLAKIMRVMVETFLCVTQFGFCSIYFVFITENLHQILESYGFDISFNITMLMCLLPAMLPSLLTNLKYISPVSALASFSLIFGMVATLSIALSSGPMPSPAERHLFTNGSQMSLFFGTALFSFEGVALILPLRNAMKKPEKFNSRYGVLNVTMVGITSIFIITGFISYLRWGEDVQGSITLNLDPSNTLSQVVKIAAALGVFFGYPIQFFIMIRIIWPPMKQNYNSAQKYPITLQVILRFIMVLLTFGVALLVPKLHLFISLIGAFCSTALAFVFPVFVDFVIRAQRPKGLNTWVYLKNIVILIIATLGIITGTYESINEIVKEFLE